MPAPHYHGLYINRGREDESANVEKRQDCQQETTSLADADFPDAASGHFKKHLLHMCLFNAKCRAFIVFEHFKSVSKRENQWKSLRVCNSRPCRSLNLHLVTGLLFSDSHHFEDTQNVLGCPE